MFTKNKILLGLALALFTFAAPDRAQALPFFFQTQVPVAGYPGWYYSRNFGYYHLGPFNIGGIRYSWPFFYKLGFGLLYYWPDEIQGESYFYDFSTGDWLNADTRTWDVEAHPSRTWFYSERLSSDLLYLESYNVNIRVFYKVNGARWIRYPCPPYPFCDW